MGMAASRVEYDRLSLIVQHNLVSLAKQNVKCSYLEEELHLGNVLLSSS